MPWYKDAQKVLVVGAKEGSLGEAVLDECNRRHDTFLAVAAGVPSMKFKSRESFQMTVTSPKSILDTLLLVDPDHIVVTAGTPSGKAVGDDGFREDFENAFKVNVFGVIDVLNVWLQIIERVHPDDGRVRHFVAISSNSAHIARTNSAGYCASKAALSMALRVAGREQARHGRVKVYGYEPGLLAGTPMTAATREALGPIPPMTRMEGLPLGLSVHDVATYIVNGLETDGMMLNGSLVRLDAGEQ